MKKYHSKKKKIPEALQSIRNGAWKALKSISQSEERNLTKFSTRSLEKSLVSIIKRDSKKNVQKLKEKKKKLFAVSFENKWIIMHFFSFFFRTRYILC